MQIKQSCLRDFDTLNKLGEGAFGQVFKVKRKADGKEYAMKKVKIGSMKEKQRENALNEIRILASFDGEYIIGYKQAFYDETSLTLCIVMEFASNGDLLKKTQTHLKARTKFKEQEIWNAMVHMTKGLKSLHEKKILHRDLKCANVFITNEGVYKLGDLNVSKVLKKDMAQTQTGTPYYASPEVWKDKPYGVKSDMWSLGCVLYEMAALRPPFTANDLQGLYKKVCAGHFQRIPAVYSNDLATVISSLLKVQPSKRPDADQLLGNSLVHNNYKGNLGNVTEKMEQCDQLLKTIKYNPRDLRGLKNILPKANYEGVVDSERGGIQSCKISRKSQKTEVSVENKTPLVLQNEKKLQQFLDRRRQIEQNERLNKLKLMNEQKQQISRQRERVLSACGVRKPYMCESPRIATHNKNDDSTSRASVMNQKPPQQPNLQQQPKLPPKPNGNINYRLPPKPVASYNSVNPNNKSVQKTQRDNSKQNLKQAGERILNGGRPGSSSSRETGITRSSSASKVVHPSWWG